MAHVHGSPAPPAALLGAFHLPVVLRHPSTRVGALAAATCSAVVTVPGALHYAFWQDEVASARVIDEPTLWAALGRIEHTESTPPAWYLLAWLAHRLGLSMTELRLISALSSALTAALVVVLASRILSAWGAALAGLLVAFGWQFVFHGRELRAYALLALLAVLFALVLERALRDSTLPTLAALAAVAAAGSMTHYFFLLTLAAGGVWVLVAARSLRVRMRVLLAAALGLIPYAAWAHVFADQYALARFGWIGPFELRAVVEHVWLTFARGFPPYGAAREILAPAALAAVIAGSIVLLRDRERGRLAALLALVPPLLAAGIWLAGPHVFLARNLIGAAPFAAIAIAAAVERMPRATGALAGVLLVAASVVGVARTERAAPVAYDRVAAAAVAEGWTSASPILIAAGWPVRPPLAWYLPDHPKLVAVQPLPRTCDAIYVVAEGAANTRRLEQSPLRIDRERLVGTFLVARLAPTSPERVLALVPTGALVEAEGSTASCVQAGP